MSTNSTVSVEQTDGTIESIYVHFDGYQTGGVGEALATSYNTRLQMQAIVNAGDHRCITDGGKESYDDNSPKGVFNSFYNMLEEFGQQYNYVFTLDGVLMCYDGRGNDITAKYKVAA